MYEVHYSNNHDTGGGVEIVYTDLKSTKQKTLSVKTLKPMPNDPLMTKAGKAVYSVKGTVCSLLILPEVGRYNLQLGFPSVEEMNKIYQELGGGIQV